MQVSFTDRMPHAVIRTATALKSFICVQDQQANYMHLLRTSYLPNCPFGYGRNIPAGAWRQSVVSTTIQRHDVASALILLNLNLMGPFGYQLSNFSRGLEFRFLSLLTDCSNKEPRAPTAAPSEKLLNSLRILSGMFLNRRNDNDSSLWHLRYCKVLFYRQPTLQRPAVLEE